MSATHCTACGEVFTHADVPQSIGDDVLCSGCQLGAVALAADCGTCGQGFTVGPVLHYNGDGSVVCDLCAVAHEQDADLQREVAAFDDSLDAFESEWAATGGDHPALRDKARWDAAESFESIVATPIEAGFAALGRLDRLAERAQRWASRGRKPGDGRRPSRPSGRGGQRPNRPPAFRRFGTGIFGG